MMCSEAWEMISGDWENTEGGWFHLRFEWVREIIFMTFNN
jgi:hypothetical protein